MRCLERDRRRVLIGRYLGMVPVERDGRLTGQNRPSYADQSEFWPTIGTLRGTTSNEVFGQSLDYDLTLTIDDPFFSVKEADVLWVYAEEAAPHDYIVRKVSRSGLFTVMAAKRVDVSA